MCLFSQSITDVSNTKIFARVEGGFQHLVYQMTYMADVDLAMVLPIPVPAFSKEDAVDYINLQNYPTFFEDIENGFRAEELSSPDKFGSALAFESLIVHEVGNFEASFVPSLEDFGRLDPRFRLEDKIWEKLPEYHDFGFTVFKLKRTRNLVNVHPMAFRFPTRLQEAIFFPTIHVHDGNLPTEAEFDHALYCQTDHFEELGNSGWRRSDQVARNYMDIPKTAGIVKEDLPYWLLGLRGQLPNNDTILS